MDQIFRIQQEKKEGDLTQSYKKNPIPTENSKTNWQHKNATKNFDNTTILLYNLIILVSVENLRVACRKETHTLLGAWSGSIWYLNMFYLSCFSGLQHWNSLAFFVPFSLCSSVCRPYAVSEYIWHGKNSWWSHYLCTVLKLINILSFSLHYVGNGVD